MPYPIAMIPYTNMAPYRELGEPLGCRFISCVPSKSISMLKNGQVLAAAVPVGGIPVLNGLVDYMGNFGIGAKEKSKSVLFFSDRPFHEFRIPAKMFLTSDSASSVRLLYLLISYNQGFDDFPQQIKDPLQANGELIIGDAALNKIRDYHLLKSANTRSDDKPVYITDLATEWYKQHKLPFVFARWIIRKDAPLKAKKAMADWLAEFKEREAELVQAAVPEAARRLGIPEAEILDYFKVIRRTMTDEDLKGQELFLKEIMNHDYKYQ